MNKYPATWGLEKLGNLTKKIGSGATPKGGETAYKSSGVPLVRSMNVVFFGFKRTGLAFIDKDQAKALDSAVIEAGDILLNITGASIGRVTLAPADLDGARVNQHVCIVRPLQGLDARFLNAYISAPAMQSQIWADNYGVTRQALTKQQIVEFDIPVPPLAEQTRIADKLDTVLTRVDACRDRLARVAPLLKRFRQSVLAAATSGRLTEDWRRARGVSDGSLFGWKMVSVESLKADQLFSLAIGPFGSDLKVSDYKDSGVPLVFVRDIRSKFCEDPVRYVSPAKAVDLRAHTVEGGDILITKMGDPPGDVAIYPARRQGAVITADCIKLRVNAKLACTEYVAYVIDSPGFRDRLRAITAGVAQQKISLTRLRDFELPLAPMQEQTEIVRRVETLFAFADRLEARLKTAQTAADRLTPALLAKAFRGEMVPQDPNDEPAAELLKRLAASRDAAPKAKRGRRSATADTTP